jgi:hypothetical protein
MDSICRGIHHSRRTPEGTSVTDALDDDDDNACPPRPPAQEPQCVPAHAPELGVLLVHGIGEQKQGETLNEFAAPIVRWLSEWLAPDVQVRRLAGVLAQHIDTKDVTGSARFTRGALRTTDLPPGTPAHASATIRRDVAGGAAVEQTWLFAESWWSPQALAPRVSPFLSWLVTRGPWILLLHLSQRVGIDPGRAAARGPSPPQRWPVVAARAIARWLAVFATTLAWLGASLLLIGLWCVVSSVALVPIGYVRRRVYELLRALAGVVGDSYVLTRDPIQRAAFADTTRRSLAWLRAQGCRRIAVIAHSQGAVVASDVLLARRAPQVDLLVTLGPGIAKLDALTAREARAPHGFMWSGAAAPLSLFAVLSTLLLFNRLGAEGGPDFALWVIAAVLLVLAWHAIRTSWKTVTDSLERLQPDALLVLLMRQYQPRMRWRDFYASHDPVANGSLSRTVGARLRRIVSRRVMVLASTFQDHTAYWASRADCVSRIVQSLDACARSGLFATAVGMQRVRQARRMHGRWVRLLQALRWLPLAALLPPLRRWGEVEAAAQQLRSGIDRLGLSSVSGVIDGVQGAFGWIGTQLLGRPVSGAPVTDLCLLLLAAAVLLHAWGRIVAFWWQHMDAFSLVPVFEPSEVRSARRKQASLVLLVSAIALLPLVLSVAWALAPHMLGWRRLDELLAALAAAAGLVAALACWPWIDPRRPA